MNGGITVPERRTTKNLTDRTIRAFLAEERKADSNNWVEFAVEYLKEK